MSFTLDGVKLNIRNRGGLRSILFKMGELILSILFIVSLAGPMIFPQEARAATGVANYLSYQGRLTDQNGNPKTGTYCMKFSIYNLAGTKLWPTGAPSSSSTVVSNGVFNNDIGSADAWGTYNFYDDNDVYLDVQINTTASTCGGTWESLTPRQRLNSVPFAKVAENLYGGDARIGTGGGVTAGSQKLLKLDVVTTAEYTGQTCTLNGAVWYNSNTAVKRALVCENGIIQALTSATTTSPTSTPEAINIGGNTAGVTNLIVSGTLSLMGGNNITLSQNGNSITISGGAGGGGGFASAIAAGGVTTNGLSTINFSNANGLSFGLGAGANSSVLTASHNGLTSQSNQAVSFTSGSVAFQTLSFTNSNGFSFNSGTQGVFGSYTVPTQTVQPVAISGSNGSFAFSTVTFGNLNGMSFYTSNGSIVGSYTAGGGGGAQTLNYWDNHVGSGLVAGLAFTGSHRSLFVMPLNGFYTGFPGDITVNTAYLNLSQSGSTATMSIAYTSNFYLGVYTLNTVNSSLALLNSVNGSFGTAAAATNNSTAFVGPRFLRIYSSQWSSQPVFKQGSQYYLGWFWSSAGALNQTNSLFGYSKFSTIQRSNMINTSGTATTQGWGPFYGIYTATTGALPTSINNSQLNKVTAGAGFVPHLIFNASAVTNF